MRATALSFVLVTAAWSLAQAAEGLPTDDPTLRPYQETVATYTRRCGNSLSHVEKSDCLSDQIKALRIRTKSEFKKKIAEAEVVAAEDKIGTMSGAERSMAEKRALNKGQSAWENYTKIVCDEAAANVERSGGNGGDLEAANCTIRHLINRLNELRG